MTFKHQLASLVELDPDLAHELHEEERRQARRRLLVPVVSLAPGPWSPSAERARGGPGFGMLVVDGFLLRDVAVAATTCTELLGPGDVIRPWSHGLPAALLSSEVGWRALSRCTVALIDAPLLAALAPWPSITEALLTRAMVRVQALTTSLAINSIRSLETRLLALLWHLADHFGRVGPDGVSLPLPLTHQTVAQLAGATRPSVSTTLKRLEQRAVVTKRPGGGFVLHGEPPRLGPARPSS